MSFTTPIGYSDALSRVDAIQQQIQQIQTAFDPSAASSSGSVSADSATAAGDSGASANTFSSQLTSALGTTQSTDTGGASLPSGASQLLTSDQQQFASRLAADTGLDSGVVSAWLLAEESGGAAVSRQSSGNNDWLNIGYTDSGTYGSADSVWSNPITAADATAGWLKGQDTIPGYGTASSGIQSILSTAGQPAATQIQALQSSGWASSGYPALESLYQQMVG